MITVSRSLAYLFLDSWFSFSLQRNTRSQHWKHCFMIASFFLFAQINILTHPWCRPWPLSSFNTAHAMHQKQIYPDCWLCLETNISRFHPFPTTSITAPLSWITAKPCLPASTLAQLWSILYPEPVCSFCYSSQAMSLLHLETFKAFSRHLE